MKNNIFNLATSTGYNKSIGCAMGTSAIVNYSYIYIGLLDATKLLHDYMYKKDYLLPPILPATYSQQNRMLRL
jgi:hypothetical protein